MLKEIKHINVDTRESYYNKGNVNKLRAEFLNQGYDIPLWGTDKQFEKTGLQIKENEQPTKIMFKTVDEGYKHYPVFNFSQTEVSNKSSQTEEANKSYWTSEKNS